jgi:hypothetical protein
VDLWIVVLVHLHQVLFRLKLLELQAGVPG